MVESTHTCRVLSQGSGGTRRHLVLIPTPRRHTSDTDEVLKGEPHDALPSESGSHMCSQLKYGTTMLLVTSKGAAGDTSCLESSCNNLKDGRGRSHLFTVRRSARAFTAGSSHLRHCEDLRSKGRKKPNVAPPSGPHPTISADNLMPSEGEISRARYVQLVLCEVVFFVRERTHEPACGSRV